MTTEKRSIDKDNLQFNVSTIVVDIEGTTTSINFVKGVITKALANTTETRIKDEFIDVISVNTLISAYTIFDTLFPYAREHLEEYLKTNWAEKELQEDVALLREQAAKDKADSVEGVLEIPEGDDDEVKSSVAKNVLWQMDNDRKTKALKQLQGHIWRSGYSSGKLVGHIYDDVKDCLKSWTEGGKKIYVYSSGSVDAQKLLFGNTKEGNLLKYFSGHFDTNIGGKTESTSYTKILEHLKISISDAKDVLFLTDVPKEAQAASEAGMQAVILSREGNAPLPEDIKETFSIVSSFSDLTFEGNVKRRKLSHNENVNESNECKNESSVETVSKEVVKDVEMEVCPDDSNSVTESATDNKSDTKKASEIEVEKSNDNVKSSEDSKVENGGTVVETKSEKVEKDEIEKVKEIDGIDKLNVKENDGSVDKALVANGNCGKDNTGSSMETEDVEMKTDESSVQIKTEKDPVKNTPEENCEDVKEVSNFVNSGVSESTELNKERESETSTDQSNDKIQVSSNKDSVTVQETLSEKGTSAVVKMPDETSNENKTSSDVNLSEETNKEHEITTDVNMSEQTCEENQASTELKKSDETSDTKPEESVTTEIKMSDKMLKGSEVPTDKKISVDTSHSDKASKETETSKENGTSEGIKTSGDNAKLLEETGDNSETTSKKDHEQSKDINAKSEIKENAVDMKEEKQVVETDEKTTKVEEAKKIGEKNIKENETVELCDVHMDTNEKTDKDESTNDKDFPQVTGDNEKNSKTDEKISDVDPNKKDCMEKAEADKPNVADGKIDLPANDEKTGNNSTEETVTKEKNDKTDSEALLKSNEPESADSTKETENKTDTNSSTTNGTHENCKNGISEEENKTNECTIKEKVEKIKEISAEQNGVETPGKV